jgi:PPOX class probable F420-dependent enzyme
MPRRTKNAKFPHRVCSGPHRSRVREWVRTRRIAPREAKESMRSSPFRPIRQAILPVALLGLFAAGCTYFGHHRAQAAQPSGGHAPQHVVSRGTIPPAFLDLVTTKKAFANLATVMPNGSPQVTPVWFDFDGKYVRVNSARGRVKDKNMRRDPRVALSILDPDNPYRYLEIRGRVIKITENGAVEHTDLLARKYLGAERNPNRRSDQVRVMYVIEPRRAVGQG